LESNMLGAIEFIRATIDPMIEQRWGRIVNITSGAVKAPIAPLGLSNAARTGLTGFIAGLSRQVAQHNVIINNLLPGMFATDRLLVPMRAQAEQQGKSVEDVIEAVTQSIPARRLGDPAEFGEMCAYLCSRQAAYLVGQNVLMDGGYINSTM
ncbi:MAG: SDR family oxidoreductase, partial [Alphaproteobacteria bacterium]|nr:SDR family oxidoreductase [Alphaproteobacteria bacterium]